MNWSVLGLVIVGLPLLLGVKETYSRLTLDNIDDQLKKSDMNSTNSLEY